MVDSKENYKFGTSGIISRFEGKFGFLNIDKDSYCELSLGSELKMVKTFILQALLLPNWEVKLSLHT